MGKTNKIIQAVGLSTAIVLSNATLSVAEELSNPDKYQNLGESSGLQSKTKTGPVFLSANVLPKSIGVERQNRQLSNFSDDIFSRSISVKVSQAIEPNVTEPTDVEKLLQPPPPPIPDAQELNPSPNPLSFPTEPNEVQVGSQQPITLKQAIELAIKNNKDIENARLNVTRSEEELREARAALFPTLDLDSTITYTDSVSSQRSVNQSIEENRQLGLPDDSGLRADSLRTDFGTFDSSISINYNIYTGGSRGANISRAEKQLRFDRLGLEQVVEQTRFDAGSDYYDLQDADAQVAIEEAAVQDAAQTLKDAQLLEQAGLGTRFDVLRAEVELAQAEQRLTTALANQNIARRQLAETLSLAHQVQLTTADPIEEAGIWEFSLEESIVQAFKNRAELEQFLLQREISEEQRQIALANIRPQISAVASYDLLDRFDDDVSIVDGYTIGAQLQWRFFDAGAARASARQSETDAKISETQFSDQRNQIRFEVEQAYFSLQANKDNIGTAELAVELAAESLRLARLRFQAGVGTQTEVIDSQTQLTAARGDLLAAVIDYNQSYIQLQRAVSNLPDGGLQDLP